EGESLRHRLTREGRLPIDGPDGSTLVHWTADVNVAGQLASLAARLMVPVSQKLSSQFYAEVKKRIESQEAKAAKSKSSK
ncbi:MAG: SRPBCC domain-containing protein, partial [Chloroflexota bacterium]